MNLRSPFLTYLLVFEMLLMAPDVRAQVTPGTQAAVNLAYEGKEKFESGDFSGALESFRAAADNADSPVFDLFIARSLKALGRWVEARRAYEQALVPTVDPQNERFVSAQENARSEMEALVRAMPRLTIAAPRLPVGHKIEVELDGKPLPWPVERLEVDPGVHVMKARSGNDTFSQKFTSSPNDDLTQTLPFVETTEPPAEAHDTMKDSRGMRTAARISFGIAAAAGVAGLVTGTMTLIEAKNWKGYCEDHACENGEPIGDEKEKWQRKMLIAQVADVTLITAGVAASAGVIFFLLDRQSQRSRVAQQSIKLGLGLTRISLSTSF